MRPSLLPRVGPVALRRWLQLVSFALLVSVNLNAAEEAPAATKTPAPPAGRLVGTFEGIEVEYSPGQEELARLLAHRFAEQNEKRAEEARVEKAKETKIEPLSVAEMRANRREYLGRISALLAMKEPLPVQEECYDAFVDYYEQTMIAFQSIGAAFASAPITRVTIWARPELVERFERGEKVPGFTYDPVTKSGETKFFAQLEGGPNARLKELAEKRESLHRTYSFGGGVNNGVSAFGASVGPKRATPPSAPVPSAAAKKDEESSYFPVVIPVDLIGLPPTELAEQLWSNPGIKGGPAGAFDAMKQMAASIPKVDPTIAFIILHETTEVGLVEHYLRSTDRRWFCDGVANYVAGRVLRDIHGPEAARRAHDLAAHLTEFADLREKVDLRRWPAAENQSDDQRQTRLNFACYAFAERAVTLMNERAGEDVLTRLFAEIGKTKPDKVSIKTVEKAWQKLTHTKLDEVLAAAVTLPQPMAKK